MARNWKLLTCAWLLCACVLLACSSPSDFPQNQEIMAEDLYLFDSGKADGNFFNPERIMEDHVFEDAYFLSLDDVRSFLLSTPYNRPCFLSDFAENGKEAAEIIVDASKAYSINPLVLLVKLQVESSIIGKDIAPSTFVMDRCMGCGCHDGNPSCHGAPKGFSKQIECAASLFRRYMDDLEENGKTWTGWGPNITKITSEGLAITPQNKATAALYTYTPWVLEYEGGNWLFWNVYRKYTYHILKTRPNHRWIGGLCASDEHCVFEKGYCHQSFELENDRNPESYNGFCSQTCEKFCPDSYSAFNSYTFCVDLGRHGESDAEPLGACVSKCDDTLFPFTNGCSVGFECIMQERFNEPEMSAKVCMPVINEVETTGEEAPEEHDGESPSDQPDPHN